jgi:hypothetical protein
MSGERQLILGCLEILTGLGIALYWVLFFFFDMKPVNPPAGYLSFEHAFIVSDLLVAGFLAAGGGLLLANRELGRIISLPCGGGLVYLGVTDVSFNTTNGMYTQALSQTLQNAAINLWCVGFGLCLIVVLCRSLARNT